MSRVSCAGESNVVTSGVVAVVFALWLLLLYGGLPGPTIRQIQAFAPILLTIPVLHASRFLQVVCAETHHAKLAQWLFAKVALPAAPGE